MKNPDLDLESYNFELNKESIADRPIDGRHHSKLLVYNQATGEITHTNFLEIHKFLPEDSTLVMNQTKVFPCRLFGNKSTGGKIEVFFLSLIHTHGEYPAMIKARGKKNIGDIFDFGNLSVEITTISGEGTFLVKINCSHEQLIKFLEVNAQIPIPPYIRDGVADEKDIEDYQTMFAKNLGSVAAPTAGLHFTPEVFANLEKQNIKKAFVTLHVGAGTFKPVVSDNILEHKMHSEVFDIDSADLEILNDGKKIFAVGTTSLRVLESCYYNSKIQLPQDTERPFGTDIFLYPGKEVKSINGLLTNFHLPKSSLLMLVSAIIGREKTLELYEIAKKHDYRFFSYGDAMLILR